MQIYPSNAAAKAVAANTGHPHLGLWLASSSTKPLIITIHPSWFADGSAFYTYVPGELHLCWQCSVTLQCLKQLTGLRAGPKCSSMRSWYWSPTRPSACRGRAVSSRGQEAAAGQRTAWWRREGKRLRIVVLWPISTVAAAMGKPLNHLSSHRLFAAYEFQCRTVPWSLGSDRGVSSL